MNYEDKVKIDAAAFLFSQLLVPKIGKEKSLQIMSSWAKNFAQQDIQQKIREIGLRGRTPKDLYDCFREFHKKFGIWYEIDTENADSIVHRVLNCTMPEACSRVGWDCQEVCKAMIYPLCENVASLVNPDLMWEVVDFNPDIEVGCTYRIGYR